MFTTRHGGVSTGVFESLNFAIGQGNVKDTRENIIKNHALAAACFGLTEDDICRSYQNHSVNVEIVSNEQKGTGINKAPFPDGVDGLVTTKKNLILSIRTADCVPVLLYDYKNNICGAVHSGWRGTLGKISSNAIEKMCASGADKSSIIAAIGPCIGACCYEVGRDLLELFTQSDRDFEACFSDKNGKLHLDLTMANELVLTKSGIKAENISSSHLCTCCNKEDFFSHRRNGAARGTMNAMIMIK
jgi:YfiH family protein